MSALPATETQKRESGTKESGTKEECSSVMCKRHLLSARGLCATHFCHPLNSSQRQRLVATGLHCRMAAESVLLNLVFRVQLDEHHNAPAGEPARCKSSDTPRKDNMLMVTSLRLAFCVQLRGTLMELLANQRAKKMCGRPKMAVRGQEALVCKFCHVLYECFGNSCFSPLIPACMYVVQAKISSCAYQ